MRYKAYATVGEYVGNHNRFIRCYLYEDGSTVISAPSAMSPIVADTLASHLAMVRSERERQEREANKSRPLGSWTNCEMPVTS